MRRAQKQITHTQEKSHKHKHTTTCCSCSYSLLESGPLTLLLQHVKHSTHSIQNALKWPPAPVIMITSRLVNNALRSPRHVSTSVWQSKCHRASDPVFLTTSARSKMAIHCQRLLKRR